MAYTLDPGGGAFYAPKIDIFIEDALGREWQMATIQADYQLPQRFDLEYRAADGGFERPVVIHYAIYGSFERFIGIITEHYAGAFPLWLAPVQVMVVPIADRHLDYAGSVRQALTDAGLRAEVDDRSERMQAQAARRPGAEDPGDGRGGGSRRRGRGRVAAPAYRRVVAGRAAGRVRRRPGRPRRIAASCGRRRRANRLLPVRNRGSRE